MNRIGVIGATNTSESAARYLGKVLAENLFALVSVPAGGVGLWVMDGGNECQAGLPGTLISQ